MAEASEEQLRAAAKWMNDAYEMLNSRGAHEGHTPRQVGQCVRCSCGMRVQGTLPKESR